MKKLTEDEANQYFTKSMGKMSRARVILSAMNVGDIVLLDHHDWTQKRNGPDFLIRRMRPTCKMDFTCEKIVDGSGWIIRRIK
jgi:hypothetical protein